jgi:hypothetical protein
MQNTNIEAIISYNIFGKTLIGDNKCLYPYNIKKLTSKK